MAFTAHDILLEFVESAHTVRDWTALAEARLYGRLERKRLLDRQRMWEYRSCKLNRLKGREYWRKWFSDPHNREHKRKYMCEYSRRPEVVLSKKAFLATEHGKRKKVETQAKYRASGKCKATMAAYKLTDAFRAVRDRQNLRARAKRAEERAKREGTGVAFVSI